MDQKNLFRFTNTYKDCIMLIFLDGLFLIFMCFFIFCLWSIYYFLYEENMNGEEIYKSLSNGRPINSFYFIRTVLFICTLLSVIFMLPLDFVLCVGAYIPSHQIIKEYEQRSY